MYVLNLDAVDAVSGSNKHLFSIFMEMKVVEVVVLDALATS